MIFISRLLFSTVFVAIGVCYSPIASAETLSEAIQTLLNSYPGLKSQEQFLLASREALPQARSARRPNISANTTALLSESNLLHDNLNSFSGSRTFGGSINLSQELYRGGRTRAGVGRAKANIKASEFSYKSFKQNLIVDAIRAYVNVLLQQEILNIREKNISVLALQEVAANARFEIGKNTRTDVAQAQASLLRARAALADARARMIAANTRYAELFGRLPNDLKQPSAMSNIPHSQEEALNFAEKNNPGLLGQKSRIQALEFELRSRKGERLPTASMNLNYGTTEGFTRSFVGRDDLRITGTISVPLSTGGFTRSRIREGSALLAQARFEYHNLHLSVIREVNTRWAALESAKQESKIRREQIIAAELAYNGVLEEQKLGRRSTFEVLNIERSLLEARLSSARSESNIIIESARLLEITGGLSESVRLHIK